MYLQPCAVYTYLMHFYEVQCKKYRLESENLIKKTFQILVAYNGLLGLITRWVARVRYSLASRSAAAASRRRRRRTQLLYYYYCGVVQSFREDNAVKRDYEIWVEIKVRVSKTKTTNMLIIVSIVLDITKSREFE